MSKPVLVIGYGNPSRGDDSLGPLTLDFIQRELNITNIELITDFQLQIEHALDLQDRELVLFIDASMNCGAAFDFAEIKTAKDHSYSTHAMSPAAVLSVYQSITNNLPPASFLLSIQGLNFELGEALSKQATANLQQACQFVQQLLLQANIDVWKQKLNS